MPPPPLHVSRIVAPRRPRPPCCLVLPWGAGLAGAFPLNILKNVPPAIVMSIFFHIFAAVVSVSPPRRAVGGFSRRRPPAAVDAPRL